MTGLPTRAMSTKRGRRVNSIRGRWLLLQVALGCDAMTREQPHFDLSRFPHPENESRSGRGCYASIWEFASWPGRPVGRPCCYTCGCGVDHLDRDAGTCAGERVGHGRLPYSARTLWRLAPPPALRRCVGPGQSARDWRPYTVGHWVYTNDYGWYWVTDDQEADWGWITYHYGRWYRDADYGWFWIPNDVWGPAWVDWRYGDQYVGWAPEPPDEVVVEVQDEPAYWSFVGAGDLIAPSIATVLLPFDRRAEFFRRTALVNRPVMMRGPDRHFAVNPGIPPGNIAAIRGRPLPTYQVRPRLLAGTAALPGAVQVRAADLRRDREGGNRPAARERFATRDIIRSSSTVRPM